MVLAELVTLLKFTYGVPFWFLYLKVVLILRRRSPIEFNTVFYRIVYYTGINDCVGFWVNQAINHWPNAPYISELYSELFSEQTYLISPIYLLTYFTLYVTEFSGFLLALNRFTTLYCPAKSEMLWRRHSTKMLFLFIAIPLSVCVHLIVYPVKFECSAFRDCYFDAVNLIYIPGRMRVRSSMFSIFFAFLTLILNLCSICLLAFLRRKSDNETKANRKLQVYTICVFLVLLVLSIEQCTYTYEGVMKTHNPYIQAFVNTYAHLYDLTLLMSGVLLLLTSSLVRRHFFKRRKIHRFIFTVLKKGKNSNRGTVIFITTNITVHRNSNQSKCNINSAIRG